MYNKKEVDRKYYLEHRDKIRARSKEYYETYKIVKEYPDKF